MRAVTLISPIMTAGDMTWVDWLLISACGLLVFSISVALRRIWRVVILLTKKSRLEARLAEIDALIDNLRITSCQLDVLPDGTHLLYRSKDQCFLAQGHGVAQLEANLRSRFGHGRHFIWPNGRIET